jgi:RNA 2',3'-cyclic 3'-phosphodiesterase
MGIRSFLAFSLPDAFRNVIEDVLPDLRDASRDVKWVRPGSVHLTVVFLGSLPEGSLAGVKQAAAGACTGVAPFRLAVKGTGFFPNPRRPRVVWLGLEGEIERMGSLRDALQDALEPFGIQRETRPFRPHLTLGRFRKQGRMNRSLEEAMARHQDVSSPECTLSELVLFRSDLRPTGAVYTALERFPLKEG